MIPISDLIFILKKVYVLKKILLLTSISIFLFSCKEEKKNTNLDYENPYNQPDTNLTYSNPVFKPVLADPSVLQAGNYFYAYGTEDDWGSDGGYHCVPVIRSSNLVDWELVGDAFNTKPNWKSGGIWAPDVSFINGQYFMYYSFSLCGDPDPGIGYAIATQPEGPYVDQGKLFLSSEIGVNNSIDPFYIEENGTKYLFWGSFQGIYAIELAADGKSVTGEKTHIASNHLEASYIYHKDGYYYYFGSQGSCCDGFNSSYHVKVGRSENILGPYTDKNGNKLTDGAFG